MSQYNRKFWHVNRRQLLGARASRLGEMNLNGLQQVDDVSRSHKVEQQWGLTQKLLLHK